MNLPLQNPRKKPTKIRSALSAISVVSAALFVLFHHVPASAEQVYEELSDSTQSLLQARIADFAPVRHFFPSDAAHHRWLAEMSRRLQRILPANAVLQHQELREDFLKTVHYESARAGLDAQMVLSVIHVESAFRKYAISSAGARGFMQVMPFWVDLIGEPSHSLFPLRSNLRYGTVIFRHYLDIEKGNYFRALGRYNGSLGKDRYPRAVFAKWTKHWRYGDL